MWRCTKSRWVVKVRLVERAVKILKQKQVRLVVESGKNTKTETASATAATEITTKTTTTTTNVTICSDWREHRNSQKTTNFLCGNVLLSYVSTA